MKYRTKPVIVEAIRFNGYNHDKIKAWSNGAVVSAKPWKPNYVMMEIKTPEGVFDVNEGDWVIKGWVDQYYTCDHEIFIHRYEPVGDE